MSPRSLVRRFAPNGGASIALAKLVDLAALSVLGRASNTVGVMAAIVAANDGEVLRRSGTTVGFGTAAVAGGGTGATTAAGARTNLGAAPSARSIATTAPLAGGGDLSGDRTLSIGAADAANAGSMSAADFNKLAAQQVDVFEATIPITAVQTTDATVTTCGTYTLADQKVAHVTAKVVALKSDASTGGTWVLEAAFRRNGASVSQIGTTTLLIATKDVAAATWSATIDASGTDIRIRVTGQAAVTANWSSSATIKLGP